MNIVNFLKGYKLFMGCCDCNCRRKASDLDFDHVRGVKLFNVSMNRHHSIIEILHEIEKCVIRCKQCHGMRHYKSSAAKTVFATLPKYANQAERQRDFRKHGSAIERINIEENNT